MFVAPCLVVQMQLLFVKELSIHIQSICVSLICCVDVISRLSVHKPSRVGEQVHRFAERRTRIVVCTLLPQSLQLAAFVCVGAEILYFPEDQRLQQSATRSGHNIGCKACTSGRRRFDCCRGLFPAKGLLLGFPTQVTFIEDPNFVAVLDVGRFQMSRSSQWSIDMFLAR